MQELIQVLKDIETKCSNMTPGNLGDFINKSGGGPGSGPSGGAVTN